MGSEELLPCPFCGGKALENADREGHRTIGCEGCPTFYNVGLTRETTTEQSVKLWNTRTTQNLVILGQRLQKVQSQLQACRATITALRTTLAEVESERDEARKGENIQCTIRYMLQDELDAIKSTPSMAEIDAAVEVIYEGIVEYKIDHDCEDELGKLADLARRYATVLEGMTKLLKKAILSDGVYCQLIKRSVNIGYGYLTKEDCREITKIVKGK